MPPNTDPVNTTGMPVVIPVTFASVITLLAMFVAVIVRVAGVNTRLNGCGTST